ncbi:hypothetical protein B0T26DRAFT_634278 [Lasiosphaeria miniovina]|uniref:C2H2 type master regulator of conidiophore development brlA n=1 Tax=Lasiosphaeria miniovina TaxID=1954250 RepID=A0AA40BFP4_9PEZI|nr:uncharacterized protein B0T26DRAFT_634278 [Lasiosphaeria miniovina]KAK0733380.1 hypothetical protein B0T26DRAFT_634278 [Lasiosphaeria miniovina]
MHARDASGRQVSLLNDDLTSHSRHHHSQRQQQQYSYDNAYDNAAAAPPSYYVPAPRSASSSPNTPELLRSDSYDSQMSNEPMSPLTPAFDYSRGYTASITLADPRSQYEDYMDPAQAYQDLKHPSVYNNSRAASYDDEAGASPTAGDRSGKRYPCRYRDSHGCEKTFTTSGHASRHSKIHTAEKAVPCSFQGCSKKFTRADNMKQHLETHYKDKSRTSSSSSRPALSSSERRSSSSGKSSSRSKAAAHAAAAAAAAATPGTPGTPLPSSGGVWDLRGLDLPLLSRPTAGRTPSSGLDALAMAVVCQEGA